MSPLSLLTAFDGRIGRTSFWCGSAVVAVALFIIEKAASRFAPSQAAAVIAFAGAFALYPWAALAAKRACDRGRTGRFGIAVVAAIVLCGLASQVVADGPGRILDAVSMALWLFALIDFGLLPATPRDLPFAQPEPDARAG